MNQENHAGGVVSPPAGERPDNQVAMRLATAATELALTAGLNAGLLDSEGRFAESWRKWSVQSGEPWRDRVWRKSCLSSRGAAGLSSAGGPGSGAHDRVRSPEELGGAAAGPPGRDRRGQSCLYAVLFRHRQHRQSVPAVDRESHRGVDDDADHHQRRNRPVGGFGDGARRLPDGLPVSTRRAVAAGHRSLALSPEPSPG